MLSRGISLCRGAGSAYSRMLQQRPLATKAGTAGFLMAMGDLCSQGLEIQSHKQRLAQKREALAVRLGEEKAERVMEEMECKGFDPMRTVRMAATGALVVGPMLHGWYGILDKVVKVKGSAMRVAMVKLGLDQFVFAPVIIGCVYVAMGVMEGKGRQGIQESFEDSYMEALKLNYVVWPLGNYFNFRYVPAEYRVLYASCISFLWNTILSHVRNSHHEDHLEEEAVV